MGHDLERLKAALAGRYEIEREIGAGGMATVYLARDLRHERRVALKVLRPDLAEGLGPDRFLQEVRVTANLQHPHILPLFDSGEAGGFLFYVMPYIEGESLRERLNREGELPITEVARLLRDVVDALAAAHRVGIVHRDIKPENVLLTGRHALVADFGVAKAITEATGRHRLTTMGVALGTPYYMAPEQAAAESNIDHRADIYAVGAMGYELLAGRPPFTGPTPQQILTAHVTRRPERITELRPSAPPGLETLVMRCLEKKPADRWQTADEMLPYLEAAMTPSGGITPTGMQPVTLPVSPVRRVPGWAIAAGVVLVAGAAALWANGGRGDAGAAVSAQGGGTDAGGLDSLRVVIVPLENRTGTPEFDVWGNLAAEAAIRLTARALPVLDVVPASAVREASVGPGAAPTPRSVAEELGARWAVGGSYAVVGLDVRFDVEITDAATGELLLAMDPMTGPRDPLQRTLEEVGERVAAATAAYVRPNAGAMSLRGFRPPSTLQSLGLYWEAMDAFCRLRYDDVLLTLERVVEIDPEFTSAAVGMIPTYNNGGRGTLSIDSIHALARGHVPTMSQSERGRYVWLTATDRETELRAALDFWRGGAGGADSYGAAYAVAYSALNLNRVSLAVEAVEDLDYDDPCFRQWPAYWSARTTAHHLVGDYETERTHAQEARRRFPASARFPPAEARAAAALGDLEAIDPLVEAIVTLPAAASTVVNALSDLGQELERHGRPDLARSVYARAYALATGRSSVSAAARAEAAYRSLPPAEALPAVQAFADESPTNSDALAYLALSLDRLGRGDEANAIVARLREVAPNSRWPGVIAGSRGDAQRTVDELRRAMNAGGTFYGVGNLFLHYVPELAPVREDPVFQAFMSPRE